MSSEIEKEVLAEFKHIAKPMIDMGLYDSTGEFVRMSQGTLSGIR
ncbi:Uncharacterised protein [uncultured archaeon]|nr:Uncharacterised protein [uncultured archaeon]